MSKNITIAAGTAVATVGLAAILNAGVAQAIPQCGGEHSVTGLPCSDNHSGNTGGATANSPQSTGAPAATGDYHWEIGIDRTGKVTSVDRVKNTAQ